jgi:hypothetical protein
MVWMMRAGLGGGGSLETMSALITPTMQWSQHPIVYFVAGMLVPTMSYFFLARIGVKNKTAKVNLGHDYSDDSDSDSDDDNGASPIVDGCSPGASWSIRDAPYKMVLCVNTSLGMGKGE